MTCSSSNRSPDQNLNLPRCVIVYIFICQQTIVNKHDQHFHISRSVQTRQNRRTCNPIDTVATSLSTMKPSKSIPRTTLRKILKAYTTKNLSRNIDVFVYLNYIMFMRTLIQASTRKAKMAGEKRITPKIIRMVTLKTLKQFKG